jgi:hypothetical protein
VSYKKARGAVFVPARGAFFVPCCGAMCHFLLIRKLLFWFNCCVACCETAGFGRISNGLFGRERPCLRSGAVAAVMSGIVGFGGRAGIPKNLKPVELQPSPMTWQIVAAAAAAAAAAAVAGHFTSAPACELRIQVI